MILAENTSDHFDTQRSLLDSTETANGREATRMGKAKGPLAPLS